MAFQSAPDCCHAVFHFTTDDKEWTIGLWFYYPDFESSDVSALATWLGVWAAANLPALLATATTIDYIDVYDMEQEDGMVYRVTLGIPGVAVGGAIAVNDALIITMYAEDRGPWNRGRFYWTGFPESDAGSSDVLDAYADSVVAAFGTLLSDGPAPFNWCVVSRYLHEVKRPTAVYNPVLAIRFRNLTMGTQRRRLRKG